MTRSRRPRLPGLTIPGEFGDVLGGAIESKVARSIGRRTLAGVARAVWQNPVPRSPYIDMLPGYHVGRKLAGTLGVMAFVDADDWGVLTAVTLRTKEDRFRVEHGEEPDGGLLLLEGLDENVIDDGAELPIAAYPDRVDARFRATAAVNDFFVRVQGRLQA